jgi:hypothetical protein
VPVVITRLKTYVTSVAYDSILELPPNNASRIQQFQQSRDSAALSCSSPPSLHKPESHDHAHTVLMHCSQQRCEVPASAGHMLTRPAADSQPPINPLDPMEASDPEPAVQLMRPSSDRPHDAIVPPPAPSASAPERRRSRIRRYAVDGGIRLAGEGVRCFRPENDLFEVHASNDAILPPPYHECT